MSHYKSYFLAVAMLLLLAMSSVAAEQRTLSYSVATGPSDTGLNRTLDWWADEVEKRTGGELKIKKFYMESLVKLKDAVDGVSAGIADIAYVVPAYSHSKMPLWYLSTLGFGTSDQYISTEAFRRVREHFPEIKEEERKNNMHYIAHYSVGSSVMIGKKRPYRTPQDLAGDKIKLSSRYLLAARAEGWNVTPVNVGIADFYASFDRGIIDGAVSYISSVIPFKHNEVTKYLTQLKLGQQTVPMMMNLDTWNSLTDKQQEVFNELYDEFMHRLAREELKDNQRAIEKLRKHDKYPMEIVSLTTEQRAAWEPGLKKAEELNVTRSAKYSPKAQEVFEAYLEEIANVEKEIVEQGYPWQHE